MPKIAYRNQDLESAFLELKRKTKERDEDLKKTDKGELILQKQALEESLKYLSDEVESLSTKNERLLKDLRKNDFYDCYNQILEEVCNLNKTIDVAECFEDFTCGSDLNTLTGEACSQVNQGS